MPGTAVDLKSKSGAWIVAIVVWGLTQLVTDWPATAATAAVVQQQERTACVLARLSAVLV